MVGLLGILRVRRRLPAARPERTPPRGLALMLADSGVPVLLHPAEPGAGVRGGDDAGPAAPATVRLVLVDEERKDEKDGRDGKDGLGTAGGAEDLALRDLHLGLDRPAQGGDGHRTAAIVNRLLWMQEAYGLTAGRPGAAEDPVQLRRLGLGALLAAADRRRAW